MENLDGFGRICKTQLPVIDVREKNQKPKMNAQKSNSVGLFVQNFIYVLNFIYFFDFIYDFDFIYVFDFVYVLDEKVGCIKEKMKFCV